MSQFSVIGMGDTFSIVDECDVEVASVPYEEERGVEATDSPEYRRARLFAHAPELLAACEALLQYLDDVDDHSDAADEVKHPARAAIRKAKGE